MNMTFVLPGTPIAKPRMTRRDKWMRRPCVVRYREWCDRAKAELLEAGLRIPDAARVTSLSLVAYFEPSARSKAVAGTFHRQKPDADNILKAACDFLYPKDDSAISRVSCDKLWGTPPRLVVSIDFE